ncbi:RWD domain-containing protein 4 [Octopus sinensis]|uniref:RWD domain-containing protein 4 n=1 Tax=Octopus sinensis TaxID=2607531 RepID=A0A6P7TCD8_9MOLL|nr:RWD domain-containing protein 4 [Octopus sinensis]XP_036367436.1 RWD domain-containing protein 4 [Octopus sinensis]
MNYLELQQEELEVLESIYVGDDCFKKISDTTFQYKCGEDGTSHSLLIEISWGEKYPDEVPCINLDAFYNNHLEKQCKDFLFQQIKEKSDEMLGCAMTYTLFEWVKENIGMLMVYQPTTVLVPVTAEPEVENIKEDNSKQEKQCEVKKKKEQLTKNQKKKLFDRVGNQGEIVRGSNWVDVIKHLSQTGNKLHTN